MLFVEDDDDDDGVAVAGTWESWDEWLENWE